MIVEQIWTANAYRNFNYLIACPETGEALAIDPLDHEKFLRSDPEAEKASKAKANARDAERRARKAEEELNRTP